MSCANLRIIHQQNQTKKMIFLGHQNWSLDNKTGLSIKINKLVLRAAKKVGGSWIHQKRMATADFFCSSANIMPYIDLIYLKPSYFMGDLKPRKLPCFIWMIGSKMKISFLSKLFKNNLEPLKLSNFISWHFSLRTLVVSSKWVYLNLWGCSAAWKGELISQNSNSCPSKWYEPLSSRHLQL